MTTPTPATSAQNPAISVNATHTAATASPRIVAITTAAGANTIVRTAT